ncbi:MAG: TIGR03013 family PEP-CTERM/XrtA system glycosyltransferase [Acidobacteriales bacterium]|nr:TIGR03013 family PEP-CTERM/XrtA system glycosyltransferase [Terriglobales bacterium]
MVRLFNVYYPTRTIVLFLCEALIVSGSFLLAAKILLGDSFEVTLDYEGGALKILAVTALTVLCSYYFDLYAPQRMPSRFEIYFRLMIVIGVLSMALSAICYAYPDFNIGRNVLLLGLIILTFSVLVWRSMYEWVLGQPIFREHVYVLGGGDRAKFVADTIAERKDLGMEVTRSRDRASDDLPTREEFADELIALKNVTPKMDRVIIAMQDRRGRMPVRELLDLRLAGVKVEDASTLLEKVQGKIQLEGLYPSALIFSEGFRIKTSLLLARRVVSIVIASLGLVLALPLIPLVALAVRLSSPGPILFKQQRVGLRGETFSVFKFRTMCADAEAKTGAVWATKTDPRITKVGAFLRKTRLDEIPQLWNVLRGDMGFVGPRPERPEFVKWLSEQIPYYNLRHIVRPGLTGWAQVRYQYGATLEETKQKLEYDLYYIKHMSISLDLLIVFETVKTIVLRKGAQ